MRVRFLPALFFTRDPLLAHTRPPQFGTSGFDLETTTSLGTKEQVQPEVKLGLKVSIVLVRSQPN